MTNDIRENLIRKLETLADEYVLAVSEYIDFIQDFQDVDPTTEDVRDILKGREEYSRGEYVEWRGNSF